MRLKLKPREIVLLSLVVVAAVVAFWPRFQGSGVTPRPRARAQAQESLPPVPRIDLARLEQMGSEAEVGRRDLFAFGPLRSRTDDAPAPMPAVERAPSTTAPPLEQQASRGDAGRSGLPPMNLKFIGSVGNAEGGKVAVLITERNEVLTGQPPLDLDTISTREADIHQPDRFLGRTSASRARYPCHTKCKV